MKVIYMGKGRVIIFVINIFLFGLSVIEEGKCFVWDIGNGVKGD